MNKIGKALYRFYMSEAWSWTRTVFQIAAFVGGVILLIEFLKWLGIF